MKRSSYIPELVFILIFTGISVILNLQFLEGSNINHTIAGHDEYIAVKEVYSILHPVSFRHFVMAVIGGSTLFYGRIMFYLDALFAFIPFKIWGITGMVFAVRMTHSLFLLAGLLLLSHTFLGSLRQKLIFFTGTLCLYYTMYFIMMPKPEPHQLFFLAFFLNRFRKNSWSFGRHFFWLGIAYGLKFNMLLLLPLAFILPAAREGIGKLQTQMMKGLRSFVWFLAGVATAVPCLLISPLRPVFMKTYLHETFGGTEKIYDNASLTFTDWMQGGLGGSYLGQAWMAWPLMALVVWIVFRELSVFSARRDMSVLVLLLSGLILVTVIMLTSKRLWPHYIWTGYILIFLGLATALESDQGKAMNRILPFLLIGFSASSAYFWMKRELPLYLHLSDEPEIRNNMSWSGNAMEYLRSAYPDKRIGTDGSMLYPFGEFTRADVFHPFEGKPPQSAGTHFHWYGDAPANIWEDGNAAVVFYKRHPERMMRERPNFYPEMRDSLYRLFQKRTSADFEMDTSFGEIIIYRRK